LAGLKKPTQISAIIALKYRYIHFVLHLNLNPIRLSRKYSMSLSDRSDRWNRSDRLYWNNRRFRGKNVAVPTGCAAFCGGLDHPSWPGRSPAESGQFAGTRVSAAHWSPSTHAAHDPKK